MTGAPAWRAEFAKRADKDIAQLDAKLRGRVFAAVDGLLHDEPQGDIKRLVGVEPPEYRLRVGEWRVRYQRDGVIRVVSVQRVIPRGRAYRD